MKQSMENYEMREKACSILCGERKHIDDMIHFIHAKFQNGHEVRTIARMLELSYDECYDLLTEARLRIREIVKNRENVAETA
ncbi:MAG: hypothetical protein JSV13_09505 [Nitrospiraceae bacterium]|jgi:hypothetical protein|nr:MAG: hypothetical protein JSV13_09505 [Nitrospiraceae bacterium]